MPTFFSTLSDSVLRRSPTVSSLSSRSPPATQPSSGGGGPVRNTRFLLQWRVAGAPMWNVWHLRNNFNFSHPNKTPFITKKKKKKSLNVALENIVKGLSTGAATKLSCIDVSSRSKSKNVLTGCFLFKFTTQYVTFCFEKVFSGFSLSSFMLEIFFFWNHGGESEVQLI